MIGYFAAKVSALSVVTLANILRDTSVEMEVKNNLLKDVDLNLM